MFNEGPRGSFRRDTACSNSFKLSLVLKDQGQPGQKQDTCLLLESLAFPLELGVALVKSKSRGNNGSGH